MGGVRVKGSGKTEDLEPSARSEASAAPDRVTCDGDLLITVFQKKKAFFGKESCTRCRWLSASPASERLRGGASLRMEPWREGGSGLCQQPGNDRPK